MPTSESWHGTVSGYTNHECRCELCTHANALYQREYRVRLRSAKVPKHVHGSTNGYVNYGCRCDRCSEAHRAYGRDYRGKSLANLG